MDSPAGAGVSLAGETQKHMQPDGCAQLARWRVRKFCNRWLREQARWLVLFGMLLKNSSGTACCLRDAADFRGDADASGARGKNYGRILDRFFWPVNCPCSATDCLLVTPSGAVIETAKPFIFLPCGIPCIACLASAFPHASPCTHQPREQNKAECCCG